MLKGSVYEDKQGSNGVVCRDLAGVAASMPGPGGEKGWDNAVYVVTMLEHRMNSRHLAPSGLLSDGEPSVEGMGMHGWKEKKYISQSNPERVMVEIVECLGGCPRKSL